MSENNVESQLLELGKASIRWTRAMRETDSTSETGRVLCDLLSEFDARLKADLEEYFTSRVTTTDGGDITRLMCEEEASMVRDEKLASAAFVRGYEQAREDAATIADQQAGKGRTVGDTKAIADKIRALFPSSVL